MQMRNIVLMIARGLLPTSGLQRALAKDKRIYLCAVYVWHAQERDVVGAFFALALLAEANASMEPVLNSVGQLCFGMQGRLPVVSMLMVTVGAVVYASGQIMGAETRARANVWATAALTGAMTAMLIASVSPPVLAAMYPGMRTDCSIQCPVGCNGGPVYAPPGGSCCTTISVGTVTEGCNWHCGAAAPVCYQSSGGIGNCCPYGTVLPAVGGTAPSSCVNPSTSGGGVP